MKGGFSLIEALVALAIAAMSLTAILGLEHQLIEGQRRYEAAIVRADLKKNALTIIREVNPDAMPEGEVPLPPRHSVRWTATPLYTPKVSAGFPRGDGRYSVNLYTVDVEIIGPTGQPEQAFQVERIGWTNGAAAPVGSGPIRR